jgi:RHS repeat-associated protein
MNVPREDEASVSTAHHLRLIALTPYGHKPVPGAVQTLLGFNGEYQDVETGLYLLGTGYHRPFSARVMRFISPDSWSPFGRGGLNTYAYLSGDPINHIDPSGHAPKRMPPQTPAVIPRVGAGDRRASQLAQLPIDPEHLRAARMRRASAPSMTGPRKSSLTSSIGSESRRNSLLMPDPLNRSRRSSGASSGSRRLSGVDPLDWSEALVDRWNYSKANAIFKKSGLSNAEQANFDTFQNALHNLGVHPKIAASFIGGSDYKQLDADSNLFQIRLSQSERVTFTVSDKLVEIRQVGGHT